MTKILDQKAPAGLELARRVKRHGTQNPAGNTSVTKGTFRVASDEGLIVEGSERITGLWFLDGVGEVTGSISIFGGPDGAGSLYASGLVDFEGQFTASGMNLLTGTNRLIGPTSIEGELTISGAVDITGDLTSVGAVTLEGAVGISGALTISGPLTSTGEVTLNGAVGISGALTSTGDVFLNGTTRINGSGFITGALTISGATKVMSSFEASGATTLGGTVTISGAATLSSTLTVNGAIVAGGVRIESNQITVNAGGRTTAIGSVGIQSSYATFETLEASSTVYFSGLADATSTSGLKFLAVTSGGAVVQVPQSVGGPMGDLEWPFDPETNTDEFGPRVSPGGIGSTNHMGMDFGIGLGEGTPIPAAGSGTVHEKGSGGGFGNYIVIQHAGNKRTLYAHMNAPSPLNVNDGVAKGQIVGQIGNTGNSTGPHLHFETHIDGEPVNPRSVITKPWSAS